MCRRDVSYLRGTIGAVYEEWAATLPHVVAWRGVTLPGAGPNRILPDGCLDLIWHDGVVFVAGPDTTAQVGSASPGSRYVAALTAAVSRRWQGADRAMVALAGAARAGLPVGLAAERCGLSPRQLQRRSTSAFGYGPKTLHRILRLQRAVALARAGRPFATVSAEAGYADQAHLAREVRAMVGVPLSTLIR